MLFIFDGFVLIELLAGQVHRATLRGQEVVVKVQRPGLKDLFDIDLRNLRVIVWSDCMLLKAILLSVL